MFRVIATPPIMPPNCKGLNNHRKSHSHKLQLALFLPNRRPGNLFKDIITVSPVRMVCLPNSSWRATFTKQLKTITQKVIKPALAPSVVVEINSPEPTTEADKINPGPRYFIRPKKVTGGFLINSFVRI